MTSPLKNVSIEEMEKAIAEALHKLSGEKMELRVAIKEAKFDGMSAGLSLNVWRNPEALWKHLSQDAVTTPSVGAGNPPE